MITIYHHQQGFSNLPDKQVPMVLRHTVSVIIEQDGTLSKNQYGIIGIKIPNKIIAKLYQLKLNQIERFFSNLPHSLELYTFT